MKTKKQKIKKSKREREPYHGEDAVPPGSMGSKGRDRRPTVSAFLETSRDRDQFIGVMQRSATRGPLAAYSIVRPTITICMKIWNTIYLTFVDKNWYLRVLSLSVKHTFEY